VESIDFWKLCDELTVVQAALLVAGHNPSNHTEVEGWISTRQPEGYPATRHAIMAAIEAKRIKGSIGYFRNDIDGDEYVSPIASKVDVDSLKEWLIEKGLTKHFFFFPENKISEFLDKEHPRYSLKLAAVVNAWNWLDTQGKLENRTPKQATQKWLRKHAAEFGLCDEDGKPNESVIDSLSQVVNWRTKGGSPKTPSKLEEGEPTVIATAQLSVSKRSKPTKRLQSHELDDDIPF
jgi:hypothetical protein